jgi:hypothetical protein
LFYSKFSYYVYTAIYIIWLCTNKYFSFSLLKTTTTMKATNLRHLATLLRENRPISSITITQSSGDATCMNLLCERVGLSCICRIASTFENYNKQQPQLLHEVTELILAGMNFTQLPDFSMIFPKLQRLDISGSHFKQLPMYSFPYLKELDISNSPYLQPITNWSLVESSFPQLEWLVARNISKDFFHALPNNTNPILRFKILQ